MKKIEVKVRYLFEGTYTVAADDRNEARTMVTRDCGLVLGGNIHSTLDDDEVDWEFRCSPRYADYILHRVGEDAKAEASEDGLLRQDRDTP